MPLPSQTPLTTLRPGIHGFAVELLAEIFKLLANTDVSRASSFDVSPHTWVAKAHSTLGGLSLICRSWRDIIVSAPMLWTTIIGYVDGHASPESYIPLFLLRSRNLPLFVYFCRRDGARPTLDLGERDTVENFMKMLLGSHGRISTLSMEAYQSSSLPNISNLFSDARRAFKGLDTLVLRSHHDESILFRRSTTLATTPSPAVRTFPNIPSLRVLSIDGQGMLRMLEEVSDLSASLQGLETLAVIHLTFRTGFFTHQRVNTLFDVISDLPKLSTLIFDGFEVKDEHQVSHRLSTPASPPSIRQLVLNNMEGKSIEHILKRIHHPEELILVGCFFTQPLDFTTDSCTRVKIVSEDASYAGTFVELHRSNFEITRSSYPLEDRDLFSKLTSLLMIDCRRLSRAVQIARVAHLPDVPLPSRRTFFLSEFDSSEPMQDPENVAE